MKDIIRKVLLGVMFETLQSLLLRRLISSYAAMIDLFVNTLISKTGNIQEYSDYVARDLECARGNEQKRWTCG